MDRVIWQFVDSIERISGEKISRQFEYLLGEETWEEEKSKWQIKINHPPVAVLISS